MKRAAPDDDFDAPEKYRCPGCEKLLGSAQAMRYHLRNNVCEKAGPYVYLSPVKCRVLLPGGEWALGKPQPSHDLDNGPNPQNPKQRKRFRKPRPRAKAPTPPSPPLSEADEEEVPDDEEESEDFLYPTHPKMRLRAAPQPPVQIPSPKPPPPVQQVKPMEILKIERRERSKADIEDEQRRFDLKVQEVAQKHIERLHSLIDGFRKLPQKPATLS